MSAKVETKDRESIFRLIISSRCGRMTDKDQQNLMHCLSYSNQVWVGTVDGKFVCAWGLILPSLLSENAYLWLYHTEAVNDHKFLFVRNSQRAVAEMLKTHPVIIGHVDVRNEDSVRWLKWLGATLSEPTNHVSPFIIRKA